MKRPRHWLRRLFIFGLLLVAAQYVFLRWVTPRYILRALERTVGGTLIAERVSVSLPFTAVLNGVRLTTNSSQCALTIQRATLRLKGFSLPLRALWIDSLEVEQPLVRISRTSDGTIMWPHLGPVAPQSHTPEAAASWLARVWRGLADWRIEVSTINIIDGVLEWLDEKPPGGFHGAVGHLSLVVGPVTIPKNEETQTSFAVRGKFTGASGHAAPMYCSGSIGVSQGDLRASCQLEPLALAAFEPYYLGPTQVRVYATTLNSTSQWTARANELKGRIQLELTNLQEGDLSVHGRTILDIKKVAVNGEPRLTGEISVTGPLNDPTAWQGEFLPGDEQTQALVTKLMKRGVQIVRVPLGAHKVDVRIAPASPEIMTDIEAASREVQEALELLAAPLPEEQPPAPLATEATTTPPQKPTPPTPTPETLTQEPILSTPAASPALPSPSSVP